MFLRIGSVPPYFEPLSAVGVYFPFQLYWIGGSGSWSDVNHWSFNSGGVSAGIVPTALYDAVFDQNAAPGAYTVTVDIAATMHDLLIRSAPSGGGTITWAGSQASSISGSLLLLAGMTRTYTGALTFAGTSVGNYINQNGVALASNLIFSGSGGGWAAVAAINTTGNITHSAGSMDYAGNSVNCAAFTMNNAAASVTLGTASVTLTAFWLVSAGTLSAALSTITGGTGGSFTGGGNAYGTVTLMMNSSAGTISGANSFVNLTLLNNASKTCVWTLNADQIVSGVLKYLGNSAVNNFCIQSDVVGTPRTITAAAIDAASDFVCFRDITGAGAAAPFATGTRIGDCGGNSGITATVSSTQTATGTAGFTWSTHAWSGSPAHVPPLPQDDVVVGNAFVASQTVTIDMPRIGKSIDFSGCTGGPTVTHAAVFEFYGSWKQSASMINTGASTVTASGRGTSVLLSNGVQWVAPLVQNGPGGTYGLSDAFNSTSTLSLTSGTFNDNGFSVTVSQFIWNGAVAGTLNKSGNWTITGTQWNLNNATIVLNDTAGYIKFTDTGPAAKTFAGAGKSYAQVWLSGTGSGGLMVSGANTITLFKNDKTGVTVRWPGGVTNTVGDYQGSGVAPGGSDYAFTRFFVGGIVTTPDAAANRITGDVAIIVYAEAEDWAQATGVNWSSLGKRTAASGASSYNFLTPPTGLSGKLRALFSLDGTNTLIFDSSVATGFAAGSGHWVAVTRNATTGDVKFWTSNDPQSTAMASVTWSQLGTTQAGATGNLAAGDSSLTAGGVGAANFLGRISRAALLNSTNLAAAAVADYNAATYTTGTTWVSATGETWSIIASATGTPQMMATNRVGIGSTTNVAATVTKSGGGTIDMDYLAINRSTVTPADTWFAGDHSLDEGSNTGWKFSARIFQTSSTLAAQASAASGAGVSGSVATGALAAQAAAASGAAMAAWVATGALVSGASAAGGAGVSLSTGSGSLVANFAQLVAVGEITLPPRIAARMIGQTFTPARMLGVTYTPPTLIGVVQ